jgi:CNT family concentrative nucleoside transporter
MERLISVLGLVVFVGVAYAFSVNRRAVRWQTVLGAIALQLIFALFILKTAPGFALFSFLGEWVNQFLDFSDAGAKFVFAEQFEENYFAFKVLPTIIFFSSFITLLYHYGILQQVVKGVAWVMMKTLKTSGAESLAAAANIFVGQTEAPLLIKP